MKIEFDTKEITEEELTVLRLFDHEHQRLITEYKERIAALERKFEELEQKKPEPYRRVDVTARIKQVFAHPDALFTVQELMAKIDHDNYGSVYATLQFLKKQGVLACTASRPLRYFAKSAGNPELRSMLPSGTKVEVMG